MNYESDIKYRKKFSEICNTIFSAKDVDSILINLREGISQILQAERITIYIVDNKKRELVSCFKRGNKVKEYSVPVSYTNLAGYCALRRRLLNIQDAYDERELTAIDPFLKFDSGPDKKQGFRTKQALACAIIHKNFLFGVVELKNLKIGDFFTKHDEFSISKLCEITGFALYSRKKRATKTRPHKFDYLIENNIVTQKELDLATVESRERNEPIETILIDKFKISKNHIGNSLSMFYKARFIEYNKNMPIPGELFGNLKIEFLKRNLWVPLKADKNKVLVAIDNPHDSQKINNIKMLMSGKEIVFYVALKEDILALIALFTQDKKEFKSTKKIPSHSLTQPEQVNNQESEEAEHDSAVINLVNKIITDGYERNASDIHIEPYPGKDSIQVRIRVDGVCTLYRTIPYAFKNPIISRIKIMADLDIAERRKPQDGKIKFRLSNRKHIELRVVTVPTQGGIEDIVIRILPDGRPIALDKLGLKKNNYNNFVKAITRSYGIILICGPTGSGKTTSLHSALGYINKPETKIWTAEDPIEITQKGLRQVQIIRKIGFDFASAMRAFLRADPDVIMIGEMRDRETASICIKASLTGHLVFSTLHTNSAPESITRLLEMGMDPFNFADAILCIAAQRLARTLCRECREPFHPSKEEFYQLVREYGHEDFRNNLGILYSDDLMLNRPVGCKKCSNTGYLGRMGLHELLMGTDEIKKKIRTNQGLESIREQARKDGMITLKQDGIGKIFDGDLDLIQVRKVCM